MLSCCSRRCKSGSWLPDGEVVVAVHVSDLCNGCASFVASELADPSQVPALAASPAAELAQHVGQALLVVRADETSRAALDDAQQLLSACADIKLLLNATRYNTSGRRFGTYGTRSK
jgi:hypothetical protein